MRHIHRMILRSLPGPFLGWLGTLMFLLLMQFLIRYLPDIVGKGLPAGVIVELVSYNLAYMVVLAVPMSVLIATLMGFGQLAETNAYAVLKSAGISFPALVWPVLLVGVLLAGCMMYFNNVVLPEANFRAKNLWMDIRQAKPGFALEEGVFYEGIEDYSILVVNVRQGGSVLEDVTIYDYSQGSARQVVIKAAEGAVRTVAGGTRMELELRDGEVHRLLPPREPLGPDRYERLAFGRHRLTLDLTDLSFERSDPDEGFRSDRTMRTSEMVAVVDSLEASIARQQARLRGLEERLFTDSSRMQPEEADLELSPAPALPDTAAVVFDRAVLAGLTRDEGYRVYDLALREARSVRARIDDVNRTVASYSQRADRYRVEIYKKYSIALACLIFMLIGAPLGLSIRRGGLGTAGVLATGIFLFYWVTLVQGEKLADRGYLTPWVGMWIANIVMTIVGLWLVLYVMLDLRATPRLHTRLRRQVTRRLRPSPPARTPAHAPVRS